MKALHVNGWGMSLFFTLALPALARAEAPPPPQGQPPAVTTPAAEQPRTLISRPIQSGGYGAPVFSYTRFASRDALLVGGRGGWIVNHRLVIGGGGFGLATPTRQSATTSEPQFQHAFGYGGLWLEYLVAPMNVVHGSVGTLVGGGGITYQRLHPSASPTEEESTSVFVLDPAVGVEVNLTTFMRLGVQAGYRVVRGVDLVSLRNSGASGFAMGGLLKLGGF